MLKNSPPSPTPPHLLGHFSFILYAFLTTGSAFRWYPFSILCLYITISVKNVYACYENNLKKTYLTPSSHWQWLAATEWHDLIHFNGSLTTSSDTSDSDRGNKLLNFMQMSDFQERLPVGGKQWSSCHPSLISNFNCYRYTGAYNNFPLPQSNCI